MTTKTSTISVILMGLLSWLALGLADFNASYFLDFNIGIAEPQTWHKYSFSQPEKVWRHLNPMAILIFTLPVLAVVFLPDSPRGRIMVVVLVAFLFLADIYQLLSFEGGDRKGCEGCFGLVLVHIALGFLAILASATYSTYHFFASSRCR